jgi:Ca2+-binding EF-hand superfamily protein
VTIHKSVFLIHVLDDDEASRRGKGIDFQSFRRGLRQVAIEPKFVAQRIFDLMDSNSNRNPNSNFSKIKILQDFLEWEEFVLTMKTMQAKTLKEKVDLFFNIIDEDGNGVLEWDEVYKIAKVILQQAGGSDNDKFLHKYAKSFAKIIFDVRLCFI